MSKRLYDTHAWRKSRLRFLKQNPLCVLCEKQNRTTPATVVDHIQPHRGDATLFWDESNWQTLCVECHNSAKAIKENKGIMPGCDESGMPIDKDHPWHNE